MITITPIPAFHDNYIWMILHPGSSRVLIVDPGQAAPVIDVLKRENLKLGGILITHHHWDHTGGIEDLLQYQSVPVYGPVSLPLVTDPVKEGDTLDFEEPVCQFKVIEIPGHTLDHIAYVGEGALFCGDTLFTAGCGRLFEGSPEQMFHSLERLAALPQDTLVYCGHEYTEANLQFAKAVEPNNADILRRTDEVKLARSKNHVTVPADMSIELKTNPFLRSREPSVQAAAIQSAGKMLSEPLEVFAELRSWKDGSQ